MSSDLKQLNKVKKNSRRNTNSQEPKLVERLIKISRVSKVTKGGKKLSFRAIVVVGDCDASRIMGEKLAERSLKRNITKIVFDRGPYLYHGRIKALADGARAGGLQF